MDPDEASASPRLPERPLALLQDLAYVRYLLELPGTDRDEVRSYFEKAGMLDWYERLVAGL